MRKILDLYYDVYYRRYVPYRLPTGHERIYYYHIRKTGGTSFNHMVMLSFTNGAADPGELWDDLWAAHRHRMLIGDKVFVVGERKLLERGEYFYGTSHLPAHEISVPAKSFTLTCLRDPIERIVSHYRMLLTQKKNNSPAFRKEGHWLGRGFKDFLTRIPKEHLLRQVYMFSASFDAAEAFDRIQRMNFWFFTDDLGTAARALGDRLGFGVREVLHTNPSEVEFTPSADERSTAEDLLRVEIELYSNLSKVGSAPAGTGAAACV